MQAVIHRKNKMRTKSAFWLCLFFCSAVEAEKLILSIGESALLPLPANKTIRTGDKSLVTVQEQEDAGRFLLFAKKEGQTLLFAGQKQYELFIFPPETKIKALAWDQLIKKSWGLKWSLDKEGGFMVTGRLNRLHDWLDMAELSQQYGINYQFKASLENGLRKSARQYFKNLFKHSPPPDILWNELPFVLFPQGAQAKLYETSLQPFGLKPRPDPSWLNKAPFIEIEIALMEALSSESSGFGGTGLEEKSPLSLLSFLNFMKSRGRGKTLHHSLLVGQSGQSLKIQSGGQIPFSSYNAKAEQNSTRWKAYGLNLDITPHQDKKNRIAIDIKARFSEPLLWGAGGQAPPLKTQSIESRIVLEDGEIVRLFQINKQSGGTTNRGALSLLSPLSRLFFSGDESSQAGKFVFLQARRLENKNAPAKNTKPLGGKTRKEQ